MRVISGIFKGKKIITPPDKTTRPLKDITKESIFNIINHRMMKTFAPSKGWKHGRIG